MAGIQTSCSGNEFDALVTHHNHFQTIFPSASCKEGSSKTCPLSAFKNIFPLFLLFSFTNLSLIIQICWCLPHTLSLHSTPCSFFLISTWTSLLKPWPATSMNSSSVICSWTNEVHELHIITALSLKLPDPNFFFYLYVISMTLTNLPSQKALPLSSSIHFSSVHQWSSFTIFLVQLSF